MKYLALIILFMSFHSNSAQCVTVEQDGNVRAEAVTPDNCTSYVLVNMSEYQLLNTDIDISAFITPTDIASSFTWGFGTYILFWFMGYKIRNAKGVVRKL